MKMKMDDGREERRGESEREELLSTHGELSTFPSIISSPALEVAPHM